jgi:hypothetical protein
MPTMEVARQLGTSYWRLIGLLRSGRMYPPDRDAAGDYRWSRGDVVKARRLLAIGRQPASAGACT